MARLVLLVDDVPELRSVLRQSLRLREGFTVVAEAENGASAIIAAARHQPDLVVLDLELPDLAGHEVLTRLRAVCPAAQIVVYTGSVTPDRMPLTGEVEAFVTKDHDVTYLVDLLARLTVRRRDTARIDLGPDTSHVAVARRFVTERCRDWGCGNVAEDAELVVSELVTNALRHASGRIELTALLLDEALVVSVSDGDQPLPRLRRVRDSDEGGRGLQLVAMLASRWGSRVTPEGKVVWCELPLGPGGARSA